MNLLCKKMAAAVKRKLRWRNPLGSLFAVVCLFLKDPDRAKAWSDEEVVRRWLRLLPPRNKSCQPLAISKDWIESRLKESVVSRPPRMLVISHISLSCRSWLNSGYKCSLLNEVRHLLQ